MRMPLVLTVLALLATPALANDELALVQDTPQIGRAHV